MNRAFLLICSLIVFAQFANAQRRKHRVVPKTSIVNKTSSGVLGDTSRPRSVIVTSAFKPTLREASKIDFSAAAPPPDSVRPVLQYHVPEQNLFFTYRPDILQPLAANIDSAIHWENKDFIKAGYGNYTSPFLQAGFSLGDGQKSVISIHAKQVSSNGNLLSEDYSKTRAEVIGIFNPSDNIEWGGNLFFDNSNQYMYGYLPDTLKFTKDELRQRFTTLGGLIGLRNKKVNSYGISYNPNLSIHAFSDNRSGRETNFVLNAPFSKSFGQLFAFDLGLTADLTSYRSDSVATINNTLYYLKPALRFKTPNFNVEVGVSPTWDNSVFTMLPNITAEAKISGEKIILQAGWVGYYHKTTYESLAQINPWLQEPTFLNDTKIKEQYAGFKGSAGSHFTYNAKVSYLQFNNQPLFVNDTLSGKSFQVINESSMKDIRIHGELGYTVQEKFSLLAGLTFNQYSNLQDNAQAWGMLPLEINGSLRWEILKDVLLKSDIFFWDGAHYRNKTLGSQKLSPALDFNAGLEFPILPKFNFWVQFNNIFNNRYQRWNQYQVLGFNVLAGFVYSFSQNSISVSK